MPIRGEKNYLEYVPLGVGAVIPPWNFPFAILVGMTSAALVTGNTVVLKPSSDSPMMGWQFMEVLREVGLPDGVVNFIPGDGGEIGDYIVDHKQIRFISFTGSAAIGKRVYERASRTPDDQIWLKRVVAEMGGKDAIIVDAEADSMQLLMALLLQRLDFRDRSVLRARARLLTPRCMTSSSRSFASAST